VKTKELLIVTSCLCGVLVDAQITPGFEPGNLSVLRIGTATSTLASSGDPVFIDEYTTNGVLTNSVTIPISGPTSLIIGGTASSEGAISRSADSNFIVMVGYNTALPYSSSLSSSTSANVPRGIVTIDFNGNFNFITNTATEFSGNNVRSGASDGSNNFWMVGAVSGTVYMGLDSPVATVQSTVANSEVVDIFNGNLCFSSQKSTPEGIYSFAGLPTNAAVANLLFTTGSSSSPYGFAISPDGKTAYVADGRDAASGGGIQKYTNNGMWGLAYTLSAGSTNGARGVAVSFGTPPVIYATTTEASANTLISITDTGASAAAQVLATANVNEVFRGVQFSPQGSPPSISTPLEPQSVDQGQSAVFTVAAVGTGTLYYLWESNSTALTGWETNSSFTFTTTNVPAENFSVGVLISNTWGTAMSIATFVINSSNAPPAAPIIYSEPVSLEVNAGGTAVFTVGATGGSLSYQWRFDNTNLTDGVFINGSTTPTLTLSNLFGASAGSYYVTVTNSGGASNSTPAVLKVVDPWVNEQAADQSCLAGGTFELSVGAIGTQLTYQWTFDGTNMHGATNSMFFSSNAAAGQAGSYAVVVSGTYGMVTSAVATVYVAPTQTSFFTSNLVVLRVGDVAETLTNSGNTMFLDQFTSNGNFISTMALPDSGPSALVISGVASSEGYMTLSGDGKLLAVAGYNTERGVLTNSLSSSTSAEVPRVVGTIDGAGNYVLAASTSAAYNTDNLRAGATDGSNNFWGAGSGDGTWYFGNTSGAGPVQTNVGNCRVINIVNGGLVFSTQSGTNGLYSMAGLPETLVAPNLLFATGGSSSPEDFVFNAAGNLAYIADDSSKGGIQRWEYDGVTWTNIYTLETGVTGIGARSLAVDFGGARPIIYAITAETVTNRLIAITDAGDGSAVVTLASCPANELFRAVKFAPALSLPAAPQLGAPELAGGKLSFNLTGVAGDSYVIESSSNLTTWLPVGTNTSPFTFVLTNAAGYSQEYFRAVYFP
jgi:hypothetical protein